MAARTKKIACHVQRVLIVDDHAPTRQVLRTYLERQGIATVQAPTGEMAMHLLSAHSFDLILLDLWITDCTGLDILAQLGAKGITTPVVMMSGEAELSDVFEARRLGVIDFLHKPFELESIARILRELGDDTPAFQPATAANSHSGRLLLSGMSVYD